MRMDGRDMRMGCDNTPSFWVQVGAVQQGPELCSAAPGKHQGPVLSPVKAREMVCGESSLLNEHKHTHTHTHVHGLGVGAKQAQHSCGSPPSLLERKHPPAQVTVGNTKLII